MSVAALAELAKDGLLTTLSDRVSELLLAPAEVDALAARPDLRHLLDQAAPLGPDQAAQPLGCCTAALGGRPGAGQARPRPLPPPRLTMTHAGQAQGEPGQATPSTSLPTPTGAGREASSVTVSPGSPVRLLRAGDR